MAAIDLGHEVTIVSGPVQVEYPSKANRVDVVTTREMLEVSQRLFVTCDGLIGAAAPCDYEPRVVHTQKMSKTGEPITMELIETPDIVASIASQRREDQWVVGFALETEDARFRSIVKMQRKHCDMMVSNGPNAIDSLDNEVEILHRSGRLLDTIRGDKSVVAQGIMTWIERELLGKKLDS